MNIWGLEKKLKRIKERIKKDGITDKLQKMKRMYEHLIKKEREKQRRKKEKK